MIKEAIKIHLPSKNLGCLGFRFGKTYFDFHTLWSGGYQMFISSYWLWKLGLSKTGKGWFSLKRGFRPMR